MTSIHGSRDPGIQGSRDRVQHSASRQWSCRAPNPYIHLLPHRSMGAEACERANERATHVGGRLGFVVVVPPAHEAVLHIQVQLLVGRALVVRAARHRPAPEHRPGWGQGSRVKGASYVRLTSCEPSFSVQRRYTLWSEPKQPIRLSLKPPCGSNQDSWIKSRFTPPRTLLH